MGELVEACQQLRLLPLGRAPVPWPAGPADLVASSASLASFRTPSGCYIFDWQQLRAAFAYGLDGCGPRLSGGCALGAGARSLFGVVILGAVLIADCPVLPPPSADATCD